MINSDISIQSVSISIASFIPEYDEGVPGVQLYVLKFVTDLQQFSGFLRVFQFSLTNKTDRHMFLTIFVLLVCFFFKKKINICTK